MSKTNVWELVNKEAENIIKAIEKCEFKDRRGYRDYLEMIYNWNITDAIVSIVDVYIRVKGIEMPWDNETVELSE